MNKYSIVDDILLKATQCQLVVLRHTVIAFVNHEYYIQVMYKTKSVSREKTEISSGT